MHEDQDQDHVKKMFLHESQRDQLLDAVDAVDAAVEFETRIETRIENDHHLLLLSQNQEQHQLLHYDLVQKTHFHEHYELLEKELEERKKGRKKRKKGVSRENSVVKKCMDLYTKVLLTIHTV